MMPEGQIGDLNDHNIAFEKYDGRDGGDPAYYMYFRSKGDQAVCIDDGDISVKDKGRFALFRCIGSKSHDDFDEDDKMKRFQEIHGKDWEETMRNIDCHYSQSIAKVNGSSLTLRLNRTHSFKRPVSVQVMIEH